MNVDFSPSIGNIDVDWCWETPNGGISFTTLDSSIRLITNEILDILKQREKQWMHSYFVRHWETDRNKFNMMNPWDVNSMLNEKGIDQAINEWKKFSSTNKKIDTICASWLDRAIDTGRYIKSWQKNHIFEIRDEWLNEMYAWQLSDHKHSDLEKEFWTTSAVELRKAYKSKINNGVESVEEFDLRVSNALLYQLISSYHDHILFVAHSWTSRVFRRIIEWSTLENLNFQLLIDY